MRTSLRGRVTVGVLVLLAALLAGLFVAVDLALGARLRADLRTRLTDRATLAGQLDGSLSGRQLVDHLRGEGVTAQLCSVDSGCVVADPAPVPVADPTPPGPAAKGPAAKGPAAAKPAVERSGPTLYVRTTLADGSRLTLSVDDTSVSSTLSRLAVLETVGGLAVLLAAALLLGRVVGVALRPLDRMTEVARGIAGGDRGRRLAVPDPPRTELDRTGAAFDAMLDELESAEARLRAFLSDAGHELLTPLAGAQATAENLLRADPGRVAREQALAAVVRETSRAARLVDDLLTASRGADLPLRRGDVDLAVVAAHEVERFRLLAPDLRWMLDAEPAPVSGDPQRLGQVLSNLLANARTAVGDDGTVTVRTRVQAGTATVDVTDDGPGIPAADRERVFERLVRLDPARGRDSGGAGLGLPIARAMARAHGGDLVALPGPGGHVRLTVPASAAKAPPADGEARHDEGERRQRQHA